VRPLPVVVTKSAAAAIREAADWWAVNRSDAPTAFAGDLEKALSLISVQPGIGARAINVRLQGVRRVHLSRVHYHLYYRLSPSGTQLEVLAFWHTSRGAGPTVLVEP